MGIELKTLDILLPFVSKPGRYVGGELNTVKKNKDNLSVRMVISYPDIYEVGMSNTAIQILYKVVNDIDEYQCERVFAPWLDFEKKLRDNNIPLFSLETYTPIADFDILGFSIGYEMLCTNMLNILDLGQIPIFSKDRDDKHPIIIAGGPGIYNPEPIADFIDVFIFGDGERSILDFIDKYKEIKYLNRKKKLEEFNKFGFTYVPSLYEKSEKGYYNFTDIKKNVKRKIEIDIDELDFPNKPIVPIIKTVQDRISVEVTRGCTTGCRFCQAGFIYRPVRERKVQTIDKIVDNSIKSTGYDKVSLAALSISDYSDLPKLVKTLTYKYSSSKVSLSLPSLRINSTNFEILKIVQQVRKSGLTFAVESPDEDVRKRINKAVNDDQLISIIGKVSEFGWRLIKLYFMIGLPMAKDEEIKIKDFIVKLMRIYPRMNINVNVSLFVPKPHTPFERVKQMGLVDAEKILKSLKMKFQHTKVRIKYQNPRMSKIEAVLSRGDRDISLLVYDVFKKGERFSSWDEVFNYDLWIESAKSLEIDINKYLDAIDANMELPWNFIDTGVSKKYLEIEYNKAKNAVTTENCIYGGCPGCGICNKTVKNVLANKIDLEVTEKEVEPFDKTDVKKRITVLCRFKKEGIYRYFSHLDMINLFLKIGRKVGIPYSYTEGFNPKPRIIIPFPLPLGVESEYELIELKLDKEIDPAELTKRFNSVLPKGMEILKCAKYIDKKSTASKNYCHDYFINSNDNLLILENLNRNIIKNRNLTKNRVLSGFDYIDGGMLIRLFGNMSLKKIFPVDKIQEVLGRIKRVKIWEVIDNEIYTFI